MSQDAWQLMQEFASAVHLIKRGRDERNRLMPAVKRLIESTNGRGITHGGKAYRAHNGVITWSPAPVDSINAKLPDDDDAPPPDDDGQPNADASPSIEPGDDPSGADEFVSNINRDFRSEREVFFAGRDEPAPAAGYARLAAFSLDASKPNGGLPRNDYGFPVVNDEPARAFPA